MLTFQDQYTQCQDLSQDTDADSLTFFKTNLNIGQRLLETELGSFYTEEDDDVATEDGEPEYSLPARFIRLKKAYVTVDSERYVMTEVFDENEWQKIQEFSTTQESDVAQLIIVRRETFEIYPTPATDDNTITLVYEASGKELTAADYTTGTITTLTNGAAAITGASSVWTAAMAGRFFKTDDEVWYEISARTADTAITLTRNYEGTSIAAGTSTYTIGEMPTTPSATHHIPVYYALMNYYQGFKQNESKGAYFRSLFEADMKRAKRTYGRRYSSKYIPPRAGYGRAVINPNNYPLGMS